MNWYLPPEEFDLFYRYYRDLFPEKSVKAAVNYCRNPSPNLRPDGPYCYTQDGYELYMISAVLRENISKSFVVPDSRQDPLVYNPVSGLACFRRLGMEERCRCLPTFKKTFSLMGKFMKKVFNSILSF